MPQTNWWDEIAERVTMPWAMYVNHVIRFHGVTSLICCCSWMLCGVTYLIFWCGAANTCLAVSAPEYRPRNWHRSHLPVCRFASVFAYRRRLLLRWHQTTRSNDTCQYSHVDWLDVAHAGVPSFVRRCNSKYDSSNIKHRNGNVRVLCYLVCCIRL